jgi:hypothetical protein
MTLQPVKGWASRLIGRAGCAGIASIVLFVSMTAVTRAAVTPQEERLLSGLNSKRALNEIRHLSEQVVTTPSGLGKGTAVAGSVEEEKLAQDIARSMRSMGLQVRLEEFPVRAYHYGPALLTANGSAVTCISLDAAGAVWGSRDSIAFARGNEQQGHRLRAALVDAGAGYQADYQRLADVRGKVVLVHRELRDWPPAQITEAAHHGATAILFYDYPLAGDQLDGLRQDSMWGHEQIPAVAISRRSAQSLQKQMAHGAVEITLNNSVDVTDGHSRNVVGILRGTEMPDEWVMVAAHYDRWFAGAGDNTSGVAAVLEAARAMTAAGARPRRSVLFMATGSEEAGLEDAERDWLAGSHAFLQRHPEILRNAALVFNVDLIGWTAPTGTLMSTPDVRGQQQRLLADLGYADKIEITIPTTSAIDAWNYGVVGGAAMNHLWRATATGNPAYFPLYHTQLDVLQADRFDNMQMDLRLLTLSLWRAATEPRLPISLTALADFVGPLLNADAAKVPEVSFVDAQSALAEFRAAAAAIESLDQSIAPDQVNRLLMTTRHSLVPWLYAGNGDFEQVVRTAEYAQRVSAFDATVAALRRGDVAAAQNALGGLYEGRQCLRLSPEVYAQERTFWAGDGGWATQFGHRAPPPPPAFEAACAALTQTPAPPGAALITAFTAARADAVVSVAQGVALIAEKLAAATATLRQFVPVRPSVQQSGP